MQSSFPGWTVPNFSACLHRGSPLTTFVTLLWACSNRSMSFLLDATELYAALRGGGLPRAEWSSRITSVILLAMPLLKQPRTGLAFQAASTHWWSRWVFHQPSSQSLFPWACSQTLLCLACRFFWDCCHTVARPCTLHCWTSWGLYLPTSEACQGPSGWHSFPPMCQLHHSPWCCQQTSAPEGHRLSLVSTYTRSHWPQVFVWGQFFIHQVILSHFATGCPKRSDLWLQQCWKNMNKNQSSECSCPLTDINQWCKKKKNKSCTKSF